MSIASVSSLVSWPPAIAARTATSEPAASCVLEVDPERFQPVTNAVFNVERLELEIASLRQ